MTEFNWSEFDHHSPEWMADPGPRYREARARCPVAHSDTHGGFWLVTRYGDVDDVARDWEHFSSASGIAIPVALETRVVPQEADPPLHGEVRDQITPWFSPGAVALMEPLVRSLARELLDRAGGTSRVDIALDYSIPLASLTMLRLLGFAEGTEPSLQRDIDLLLRSRHDPVALQEAGERFGATVFAEIAGRRADGVGSRDDLLDRILGMTAGDDPVDDATAISVSMSLIFAGLETSAASIATSAYELARRPELRQRLLADPSLLPSAVEELLRFTSPVECIGRTVTVDTVVGPQALASGDRVLIAYGSANRDPDVFTEPDELVLDRPNNRHLAFGAGIHRCLGRHLARMELRVGLGELLDRFPTYEIAGPVLWGFGENRGVRSLPVSTAPDPAPAPDPNPSVVGNDGTPDQRRAAMAHRRAECPIGRVGNEDAGPWYLADYASVAAALPEVLHFGGAAGAGDVAEDLQSFNGMTEPRHGQVRRVINGLVAAHRAHDAEPFIAERSSRLVADLAARAAGAGPDGVDVMEGFVDPLPCAVIAWLLGWPSDDPLQLYRWTVTLCDRAMEMAPGSALSSADLCPDFAAYVDARIEDREALPRVSWPDDGLTHMLTSEIDGERLSRTAVRTQLMFLLGAGSETSRDLIGGLLHDLAADPVLYRRVREDRTLVPAAVEEALRLWAPTQFMVRRCLEPIAIGGHDFEPGDVVMLGLASANRDEAVFAGSDAFDVDRPNVRSHLAFGAGPHVCPGAALARAEARIALNCFLDRFEAAEIAPGGFEPIPLAMFSGPRSLRLRLS